MSLTHASSESIGVFSGQGYFRLPCHATIDSLSGKQSDAWKEKSAEMATSLKEMNDREACKNQVIHNRQGQNMHKLQDQWQELMGYAQNLGLYCFATCHGMPCLHAPNHLQSSPTPSTYIPVSLRCTLRKLAQQGEEKKLRGEVEC